METVTKPQRENCSRKGNIVHSIVMDGCKNDDVYK